MASLHAVLTGDIINSSELSSDRLEMLPDIISDEIHAVGTSAKDLFIGFYQIFRGDSWQFITKSPDSVLNVGLSLRGRLRGIHGMDTRFSIGIGEVNEKRRSGSLANHGECYKLSGKGLDEMSANQTVDIRMGSKIEGIQNFATTTARLIDAITTNWTEKQAYACALDLCGHSHEISGNVMGITKQAFGKHLAAAKWNLVKGGLDAFREEIRLHLP